MKEEKYAVQALFKALGYTPTAAQAPIHADDSRDKLIAGADRSGKSMCNAMELIKRWYLSDWDSPDSKPKIYWLIAKDYEGTRGEWNHLLAAFAKLGVLAKTPSKNIDPGTMQLKGGTEENPVISAIVTKSGQHPERISTTAPDGVLVCEAAQLEYEIRLRLLGRVAEKRGWISMAGSFEGSIGWWPEFYTRWQSHNEEGGKSFSLPMWSNTVIFPLGEKDPEILKLKEQLTTDQFNERCGGIPSVPSNRVIKEFSNAIHVGNYPFNPDLPVGLAIDPGYRGACAVEVIQQWGEQFVIVDELYMVGLGTTQIIDVCGQRPWWDAVDGGAIDIAAKAHNPDEPVVDIWRDYGNKTLAMNKVVVEEGINLLRTYLKPNPVTGKPLILVNSKCKGIISEWGGCKSPVEGGGTWMRHEQTYEALKKNDHASKALIYYLVYRVGYSGTRSSRVRKRYIIKHPSKKAFVTT